MKLLKKLATLFTLAILSLTVCVSLASCGEEPLKYPEDDDTNWDKKTYIVYVYLDDGVTPAKDVALSLCYNTASTSSCLSSAKTNEDGRVSFTLVDEVFNTVVGDPVIHFNKNVITDAYDLPAGYSFPSDVTTVNMNGGFSYEHAKTVTTKVTVLKLTKI